MGNTPPPPPIGLHRALTVNEVRESYMLTPPLQHPSLVLCAHCGRKVRPDGSGACPNCAGHEFRRSFDEIRAKYGLPPLATVPEIHKKRRRFALARWW